MIAQHKTLPDSMGAGNSWILAGQLRKANWVMDQNKQWKQQHQWEKCRLGATRMDANKI